MLLALVRKAPQDESMNHGIRNFHSPPKVEHRQEMSWNEEKLHVGPHNYYAWYAMVLKSIAWYRFSIL